VGRPKADPRHPGPCKRTPPPLVKGWTYCALVTFPNAGAGDGLADLSRRRITDVQGHSGCDHGQQEEVTLMWIFVVTILLAVFVVLSVVKRKRQR
jgi:hypothetical protein